MILKREVFTTLHCGDKLHNAILVEGTQIERDYLHAEVIWRVVGGRWGGWYFVASDKYIRSITKRP